MKTMLLILSALLALSAAQTPTKFSAEVDIFQPVDGPASTVKNKYKATLSYDFAGKLLTYVYQAPGNAALNGFKEVIDGNDKIQYKVCGKCEAYHSGEFPQLHRVAGTDTLEGTSVTTEDGRLCTGFLKPDAEAAGGVQRVWVHEPAAGSGQAPSTCKVQFSDGREVAFKVPTSVGIGAFSHSNCKAKCGAPLDLTFVIDESGSINPQEWRQMNNFIKGVIDEFVVGPDATHVGLAYFAGINFAQTQDPASCCGLAEAALPLTFNLQTINQVINTHVKRGGHTCINCGMRAAQRYYPNPNRQLQNRQVMVVISDGYNNRETNFFLQDIASVRAHAGGIRTYAVGVDNADDQQLLQIAGGEQKRVFKAANFKQLVKDVKKIAVAICKDNLDQTPCGPDCKGVCPCGKTCTCPVECTGQTVCEEAKCRSPLIGCKAEAKTCGAGPGSCPDATKCELLQCDPNVGPTQGQCIAVPARPGQPCPANCTACTEAFVQTTDKCSCPQCDPITGRCLATAKNCDDNNACTTDKCEPATGACSHTNIDCETQVNDVCQTYTCDPVRGCLTTPVDCSATEPINKCNKVVCAKGKDGKAKCVQRPLAPGLVDACGNCKNDRLPCALGSSAIAISGVATALVIVAALVGGAFAVGLGACLASSASGGAGAGSGAPAASLAHNPLYEEDMLQGTNPLYEN